jgi:hypothetical protein
MEYANMGLVENAKKRILEGVHIDGGSVLISLPAHARRVWLYTSDDENEQGTQEGREATQSVLFFLCLWLLST